MSCRWMYADAPIGLLAKMNPLRWSEWGPPAAIAAQLRAEPDADRKVTVEVKGGPTIGTVTVASAIRQLQLPMPSSMTSEERMARAVAAATVRLPAFKQEAVAALRAESDVLATNYGSRPDGFYHRFLVFNEAFHHGGSPEAALTMLLNYCRFMQRQREAGRLQGLGAEMLRPHIARGFVRVLSSRDKAGRRIVLSFPHDLDAKVCPRPTSPSCRRHHSCSCCSRRPQPPLPLP